MPLDNAVPLAMLTFIAIRQIDDVAGQFALNGGHRFESGPLRQDTY